MESILITIRQKTLKIGAYTLEGLIIHLCTYLRSK